MFSESRASTVGSNGGGEGAKEEQRRWGEYDTKTPEVGRYLEVRGSRCERDNSFINIGEAGRVAYLCCKAFEVPSLRLAEFTVTC